MKSFNEQKLQIRCVKWFRLQYPSFARLLEHPQNEDYGERLRGQLAKAEGVVAGVADLILHVPSVMHMVDGKPQEEGWHYYSLAIEMKTISGRQSVTQKIWQTYFEAAGGRYAVVRTFEQFQEVVREYMDGVPQQTRDAIYFAHDSVTDYLRETQRQHLRKIISKGGATAKKQLKRIVRI